MMDQMEEKIKSMQVELDKTKSGAKKKIRELEIQVEDLSAKINRVSMLATATPKVQKERLGTELFPLIQKTYGDRAGKLTGMMLEKDNSEILNMLEDSNYLNKKVKDAVRLLETRK